MLLKRLVVLLKLPLVILVINLIYFLLSLLVRLGDISDPKKNKYTLDYYLDVVGQLVKEGIHILGLKDMAGILKPKSATMLVGAIRKKWPDLVIHLHTHDTAGTGVATYLAAIEAGYLFIYYFF